MDRKLRSWCQVQLTLIGAKLIIADVEIGENFPPMVSCAMSEKLTPQGNRTQVLIAFGAGKLGFECEQLVCNEFSRQIQIARE